MTRYGGRISMPCPKPLKGRLEFGGRPADLKFDILPGKPPVLHQDAVIDYNPPGPVWVRCEVLKTSDPQESTFAMSLRSGSVRYFEQRGDLWEQMMEGFLEEMAVGETLCRRPLPGSDRTLLTRRPTGELDLKLTFWLRLPERGW